MLKAKDFRQRAWSRLNGNWVNAIVMVLIVSVITGACAGLSFTGVGAVAVILISGPLSLGLAQQFLKLVRGGSMEISRLFDGFKNFLNAFLLGLVNSIFIALWSLLLVVPGIIKSYAYSMSFYILADNPDMSQSAARQRSIDLMNGNKWRLFCLDLSFIGWYLLCALTFGILTLWVEPYHEAARAEFYQELLAESRNSNNGMPGAVPGGSVFGTGYSADSNNSVNGSSVRDDGDDDLRRSNRRFDDDDLRKSDRRSDDVRKTDGNGGSDGDGTPPLNADDL